MGQCSSVNTFLKQKAELYNVLILENVWTLGGGGPKSEYNKFNKLETIQKWEKKILDIHHLERMINMMKSICHV